ncbi:MAG: CD0519/CD1768 family membrane protein [Plesiomonas sp.]|uniref:CD0519/CD1768 family membrane protein n=1 Tax=Plesiomonas sp. TaxID=2486279 RepID=UPI003EE7AB18
MTTQSPDNSAILRASSIKQWVEPILVLAMLGLLFGYLGHVMGLSAMVNTLFNTAHQLLLNTILFIMGITVLSGALSQLLSEFGVIRLLEVLLAPLMRPLYRLPGRAALAGLMTFFSDNPAVISLAKDPRFRRGLRPWQLISLTNFGTAFGMGLIVVTFMATLQLNSQENTVKAALLGLAGALIGSIVSTRLMQRMIRPLVGDQPLDEASPDHSVNSTVTSPTLSPVSSSTTLPDGHSHCAPENSTVEDTAPIWLRALNALLDGGKSGVELGMAVIPGVLIISTFVMLLTFGPSAQGYTGEAFQGVGLLPVLAGKAGWLFDALFGFKHPELIAFPATSLGAVGAAMSLVPPFISKGFISGNEIAVFTAMGMCWSGFLSTHTAMLDALGYRFLTSRAIIAHTLGGLVAGISAHQLYMLFG